MGLLQRQVSRSHEHLHDQILEQMRQRNFGDSYSKKDAHNLLVVPSGIVRKRSVYVSKKDLKRRSFVDSSDEGECHNASRDVIVSNFDRNNVAYCSERPVRHAMDEFLVMGTSGDFLINRRGVDMSYDINRRNPGYVPKDLKLTRKKSDVLDKTGLRTLFQKIKIGTKTRSENKDISDSDCSTSSSTNSFSYEGARPRTGIIQLEEHFGGNTSIASNSATRKANSSADSGVFKENDTSYSSSKIVHAKSNTMENFMGANINTDSENFNRNKKIFSSERIIQPKNLVLEGNKRAKHPAYSPERKSDDGRRMKDVSRKRSHPQARPNSSRSRPECCTERERR
ncbi:uncharacterized protein [Euwallacea fornicatus]|uniref:uncharacterized protein n=1 Tax=Euwallacea fornicatus TaxID=995702 RepID=UPI00338E6B4C